MTAAALELDGVACTFVSKDDPGQRYTAVRDVALRVGPGEFVSVVGPTGCGKSTLLNVAAGLLAPSTGRVRVFGAPLEGINRRAGSRFQAESLMPWRTALQNVELPLLLTSLYLILLGPRRLPPVEPWRGLGLFLFGLTLGLDGIAIQRLMAVGLWIGIGGYLLCLLGGGLLFQDYKSRTGQRGR